jgi:hypothetical protein
MFFFCLPKLRTITEIQYKPRERIDLASIIFDEIMDPFGIEKCFRSDTVFTSEMYEFTGNIGFWNLF